MKAQIHFTLLIAAALVYHGNTRAADTAPRSYAVMSLAGDKISTVVARVAIGSNLDPNEKRVVDIPDGTFDESAVQAANATIKQLEPGSKTMLLLTQDRGLYKAQNAMFESAEANADNRNYLKSLLQNRAATHLILITKMRSDTAIRLCNGSTGAGKLEGLGFFIDNALDVTSGETGQHGVGLLAPFAYLKIRLIDAVTLQVIREVTEKQSLSAGNYNHGETGLSAWPVLTSEQKIQYLQQTIAEGVNVALPRLLKP